MTRRVFAAVFTAVGLLAGSLMLAQPAAAQPEQPPPPMTVQVNALSRTGSGIEYVLTVQNNLETPQVVEVIQRFVQTPAGVTASDSGRLQPEGITWLIDVPAKQPRAINSQATFNGSFTTRSTACIRDLATLRTLDCAAGDLAVGAVEAGPGINWFPPLLVVIAIALVGGGLYWLVRRRDRWQLRAREIVDNHRNAVVVWASAAAVVIISASGFLYLTGQARSAINLQDQPGKAIGWSGQQGQIALGVPAASRHVEFTIYRWVCVELDSGQQCGATVAVRNTSDEPQQWFARMQRLQYTDESWIEADPGLTLAANGSTDQFITPLAVGERRIAALVYLPEAGKALSRLELRDGAFSRGLAFKIG